MKAKYKFVYSTRFPQEKKPNCVSMKNYQLRYNYATKQTFEDAVNKNHIDYPYKNSLIDPLLIYSLQPKDAPLLRSSCETEPLYSRDYEATVSNYQTFPDDKKMQRKQRYIDYFKRHYGTL